MNRPLARQELALEPEFRLGPLEVSPSTCRVIHGDTEMRVEALTMSVLVVLARAGGATVTKEELINACWRGRFVSDDAIARTIAKVRLLARGREPLPFQLETVPKVGFRLVPGTATDRTEPAQVPEPPAAQTPTRPRLRRSALLVAALAVVAAGAFWSGSKYAHRVDARSVTGDGELRTNEESFLSRQVMDSVLSLDEERLTHYLNNGWQISWSIDAQGGNALTLLPDVCARDPRTDQAAVLSMGRFLVAAGADPAYRNKWGDTAYVISREGRNCGPHHPLTEYLREITPGAKLDPVDKQVGTRTP